MPPARRPSNGPRFLQEQGRGEEAEPILRRAYDLGVNAETAARKN